MTTFNLVSLTERLVKLEAKAQAQAKAIEELQKMIDSLDEDIELVEDSIDNLYVKTEKREHK